jgi:hypothetical protein
MKNEISIGFCLLSAALGSGCAFHRSTEEVLAEAGLTGTQSSPNHVAEGGLEFAVDWAPQPSPRLGEALKARRHLMRAADDLYQVDKPITLPQDTPATVYVATDYPHDRLAQGIQFARGRVRLGENVYQIVVDASISQDGSRVILVMGGVNTLLGRNHTSQGQLTIDLYSEGKKALTVEFTLRTPPANLETAEVSLRDWRASAAAVEQGLISSEIGGRRLNLLRVIELRNSEPTDLEFQMPRRPGAALTQYQNSMSHQDYNCGFHYNQNPHTEQLASDVIFLPLGEPFITLAAESMANPEVRDRLPLTIPANGTLRLGVFAVGAGADNWMDNGPGAPSAHNITVYSDCYDYCAEWVSSGPHRPEHIKRDCARWERRRNSTTITVGYDCGPVLLTVPVEFTQIAARYADLDFTMDAETRTFNLVPASSEVIWQ